MADAGGLDADAHLAGTNRRRQDVVADVELVVADVVQNGCFHFTNSALLGQESTASRALMASSPSGSSMMMCKTSSSSKSKISGAIPTHTALASHSSWSTPTRISPTAKVEHVPVRKRNAPPEPQGQRGGRFAKVAQITVRRRSVRRHRR